MSDINANNESLMVDIELKSGKSIYSTSVNAIKHQQAIGAVRSSAKVKLYGFLRSYLWLLPALTGLTIILLFVIVYGMAVKNSNMVKFLPYISDAGTFNSQAGLFTLLLNLIAILTALSAIVRYKQLKHYFQMVMLPTVIGHSSSPNEQQMSLIRRLNNANFASLLLILAGAFGATVTASFRSSEWIWVHTTGANLIFFGTYAYAWIMVWMSHQAAEAKLESRPVSLIVFIAIGTMAFVVCMIALLVSMFMSDPVGKFFDANYRLSWNNQVSGFWWHVLSTSTEWVVFLAIALVFFSLANRMRIFKNWSLVQF